MTLRRIGMDARLHELDRGEWLTLFGEWFVTGTREWVTYGILDPVLTGGPREISPPQSGIQATRGHCND